MQSLRCAAGGPTTAKVIMASIFGLLSLTTHACMACPSCSLLVQAFSFFPRVSFVRYSAIADPGQMEEDPSEDCGQALQGGFLSRAACSGWGAPTTCSQASVREPQLSKPCKSHDWHFAQVMAVSQAHPEARSLLHFGNMRRLCHHVDGMATQVCCKLLRWQLPKVSGSIM